MSNYIVKRLPKLIQQFKQINRWRREERSLAEYDPELYNALNANIERRYDEGEHNLMFWLKRRG
jgi:hypothetical protein